MPALREEGLGRDLPRHQSLRHPLGSSTRNKACVEEGRKDGVISEEVRVRAYRIEREVYSESSDGCSGLDRGEVLWGSQGPRAGVSSVRTGMAMTPQMLRTVQLSQAILHVHQPRVH